MHDVLARPNQRVPVNTVSTETVLQMLQRADINPNYRAIVELRKLQKSDPRYDRIKKTLHCFTPNASFSGYVDSRYLSSTTGFVYVDLDNKSGFDYSREWEAVRSNQNVYAAWRSVGGRGIGCLVRTDWTPASVQTFKTVFGSAVASLESSGVCVSVVDQKCSDIARVNYISYSEQIHFNPDASSVEMVGLTEEKELTRALIPPLPCIDPCEPLLSSKRLAYKSCLSDWLKDEAFRYYPDGQDFISIHVSGGSIHPGERNNRMFVICCKLAVMNPIASEREIFNHLWSINKRFCTIPLSPIEINYIVSSVLKFRSNGTLWAPAKKRFLWFNPSAKLSVHEKLSLSGRASRSSVKQKNLAMLKESIEHLRANNITINRKNLCKHSGKSYSTVKRLWDELF